MFSTLMSSLAHESALSLGGVGARASCGPSGWAWGHAVLGGGTTAWSSWPAGRLLRLCQHPRPCRPGIPMTASCSANTSHSKVVYVPAGSSIHSAAGSPVVLRPAACRKVPKQFGKTMPQAAEVVEKMFGSRGIVQAGDRLLLPQ